MPIDEQRFYTEFGELKGTVLALVATVANTNAIAEKTNTAIFGAIKEQRVEMAKYRDDCRTAMDIHKEDDDTKHELLESLSKPIADLHDVIFGDGSKDGEPGLKSKVNTLEINTIKVNWWLKGVAALAGAIVIGIGWAVEAFKK